MRTEGRKQGLTEPIIYKGPVVSPRAEDDELNPYPTVEEWAKQISEETFIQRKDVGKGRDQLPVDIFPGKWDNGPENIFKVWKRPLHKYPYDIGKRGTKNVVV